MSVEHSSDTVEFKRIEDIHLERSGHQVELFAETTLIDGITIRATARNIFHPHEDRTRTFYSGVAGNTSIAPRSTGQILEVDQRKLQGDPSGTQVFSVRVSGTL